MSGRSGADVAGQVGLFASPCAAVVSPAYACVVLRRDGRAWRIRGWTAEWRCVAVPCDQAGKDLDEAEPEIVDEGQWVAFWREKARAQPPRATAAPRKAQTIVRRRA